jgi:hypothetical protein
MEMTGSSDGNLYGYFLDESIGDGWVVQIDKTNATILSSVPVSAGQPGNALAFAFHGGDFFIFTSPGGTTKITRYRPIDGTVDQNFGSLNGTVVGAGVSTCAPM